jgi:hypothetical protein
VLSFRRSFPLRLKRRNCNAFRGRAALAASENPLLAAFMLTTRSPRTNAAALSWPGQGSQSTVCFARLLRLKVDSKRVQTEETVSLRLAAMARRVCWWEPVAATLENTALFLCRIMALGTWDDICIALDHYGRDAFREALQNAPPGLFDPRSWHYWHHRLKLLPVPPLPQRAIPV